MDSIRSILLCSVLFCAVAVSAQDFSSFAVSMPRLKIVFSKLFIDTPEFSADGFIGTFTTNNILVSKMTMNFAVTSDRMRQDIDVMNTSIPLAWREAARKAHIDKIVVITQVDTRKVYLVFPGVQAYTEYPISDAVLAEMNKRANDVSIERKEHEQQMFDNHLCIPTTLVVREANRPPEAALLYCATDLQKFPIMLDIFEPTSITRFVFHNVQVKTPDASLFEVPSNYTEFPDAAAVSRYALNELQNNRENNTQ